MRSPVTTISLARIEGAAPSAIREMARSWTQADAVLLRWSDTVARDSGYDKCEFVVEWANGATYQGRLDLLNWRDAAPDLAKHVRELAYFYTGRQVPRHMTPPVYGAFLEMHSTKAMAVGYEKLLVDNDLGAVEHPPVQVAEEEPAVSSGLFRVSRNALPMMSR